MSAETTPGLAGEWLSGHIHIEANPYGGVGDRVLMDVIDPFTRDALAAGWIDRFFFIRYVQDGPHLRLRLHGNPETLASVVAPELEKRAGPSLRWVAYEPETARYGGPDAIGVAETLFYESSRIAIELVRSVGGNHSTRLGKGLLTTIVFLHTFVGERQSAVGYAHNYATRYLSRFAREEGAGESWTTAFDAGYQKQSAALSPVVLDAWERLVDGESLTPTLDEYRVVLERARTALVELCGEGRLSTMLGPVATMAQATMWIGSSYLHMMNNRLGVSVPEEAYLAHLVGRAFTTPVLDSAP